MEQPVVIRKIRKIFVLAVFLMLVFPATQCFALIFGLGDGEFGDFVLTGIQTTAVFLIMVLFTALTVADINVGLLGRGG